MPTRITVNPDQIAISDGSSFLVTARGFPVPYPDANVPQTWAAGSIFFFIRSILGLEADAPNRQLFVQPVLPDWLPDLTLKQLSVGDAIVSLHFYREGKQTRWQVTQLEGELTVKTR